jgi:hypothetical protein
LWRLRMFFGVHVYMGGSPRPYICPLSAPPPPLPHPPTHPPNHATAHTLPAVIDGFTGAPIPPLNPEDPASTPLSTVAVQATETPNARAQGAPRLAGRPSELSWPALDVACILLASCSCARCLAARGPQGGGGAQAPCQRHPATAPSPLSLPLPPALAPPVPNPSPLPCRTAYRRTAYRVDLPLAYFVPPISTEEGRGRLPLVLDFEQTRCVAGSAVSVATHLGTRLPCLLPVLLCCLPVPCQRVYSAR